jgi:indole-3-glycerol phosphate synthase
MGFLSDVVDEIRRDLAQRPLDHAALEAAAVAQPPPRRFEAALRDAAATDGVALIAEVKRASPSAGAIAATADPLRQALAYDGAGAAAISVLTEGRHFGGSLDDLRAVCGSVGHPVLRKDFLVDPEQVLEARAAGADTVLLISSCLDDGELASMLAACRALGMEPLVETHSDDDLERVVGTDAAIVGVNARDLETLVVDLPAALARLGRVPRDRVVVLESGIRDRAGVLAAVDAGASAILVGESLMRATDPGRAVRALIGKEEG